MNKLNAVLVRLSWVTLTLLSHYRRHPGQSIFMAVGLITGVALWTAVELINDHARASYADADRVLGAETAFWIRNKSGRGVGQGDYILLRRLGYNTLFPVIETRARTSEGDFLAIIATDLLSLGTTTDTRENDAIQAHPFSANDWLPFIQPGYQAWYPRPVATRLGIDPGDQLMLANGSVMPPALIRTQEQQGQQVFMDIGAAMALLEQEHFSYLGVRHISDSDLSTLKDNLPKDLILIENQRAIDLNQLTQSLHTNLSALGLLSFAVGLFIVFNAVRFSLVSRHTTLNTLRELGVGIPLISVAIGLETLIWSLVGTALGIISGLTLGTLLLPTVALSLQSLYGATIESTIQIHPGQIVMAWILTLIGVTLALAVPLWQKGRESIRQSRDPVSQWNMDQTWRIRLAVIATALLILASMIFSIMSSVFEGFFVLTLVLFAGALALPLIIDLALRLPLRMLTRKNWLHRWAISDALAQLPHLRIALMALILTLTANIGVTTLVDSFRTALSFWLESRLSADLYVQSTQLDTVRLLQADNTDWLISSHARVALNTRWQQRPTSIRGLETEAPDVKSMKLASQLNDGWDAWSIQTGPPYAVLANEQVHYLAGSKLGDIISLDNGGTAERFRIVGFFHDYGNAGYQFYLPAPLLRNIWPSARTEGLALWTKAGTNNRAVAALLDAGAKPGEWIQQAEILAISMTIFERTFAITAALNTLTLLVAGVALLAALMALHQLRLPEYVHWHTLGVTLPEWLWIVAMPLLLMVLVTGMASLPLGAALSWLLINKLNVMGFGWTMPLLWSWSPIIQLALITLTIVLITLMITLTGVRRSMHISIKQLAGNDG